MYVTVGLGISAVLLDVAVTVSTWVSPPPAAIPVRFTVCALASSRIAAGFAIVSRVGASFTAVTVRTKVSLVVAVPSLTVTVIVDAPNWLAAGVAVSVREAPEPPKIRFALGMSVVFAEVAATVSAPAAVSTSPIVNVSALVAPSSAMLVSAMSVIVGASFTAAKVIVTVAAGEESVPSEAVTEKVFSPFSFAAGT